MNTQHRYQLERYSTPSSRHTCPSCNQKRQFARYVDNTTGEPLHDSCGKCNRADSCGLNYTPRQYFQNNPGINKPFFIAQAKAPEPIRPVSFIPVELFEQSGSEFQDATKNSFIIWLKTLFDLQTIQDSLEKYRIGTSDHWPGAVIFWEIDTDENIRTGKVMQYDSQTGKRIKKPYNHINWIHTLNKLPEFNLQQCLYGSHLLVSDINKTVAIVESEKTAIVCSMLMPNYTWLSRGGKNGAKWYLNDVHKCLIGRRVILFPDLAYPAGKEKTPFELWSTDTEILKAAGINVTVSRFLEDNATDADRRAGADIADLLLRQHRKPP